MLQKIFSSFFSMRIMAFLVLLFFVAIGYATFIENDFGTQTAKALVYNATWFEILIIILSVNMIGNINRYKLWKKEKKEQSLLHQQPLQCEETKINIPMPLQWVAEECFANH